MLKKHVARQANSHICRQDLHTADTQRNDSTQLLNSPTVSVTGKNAFPEAIVSALPLGLALVEIMLQRSIRETEATALHESKLWGLSASFSDNAHRSLLLSMMKRFDCVATGV